MVSISIVDYIGKVKNGVAVVLTINIDDNIYQMIFWVNKECKYVLSVDEDLLNVLNVDNIYEYEYLNDLLETIFKTLPPIDELFKQFEV